MISENYILYTHIKKERKKEREYLFLYIFFYIIFYVFYIHVTGKSKCIDIRAQMYIFIICSSCGSFERNKVNAKYKTNCGCRNMNMLSQQERAESA